MSFVANQRDDVVRIPNSALRFKPPKDEKDEKKPARKDVNKKKAIEGTDAKTAANANADTPKAATTDNAAGTDASGRVRRPPARVYKLNDKNELGPIEIRTGVASNQFTEMLSGDIKPGDEVVIRDLQDKTAKK